MRDDYTASNTDLGALYPAHVEALKAHYHRALDRAGAAHAVVFSGAPKLAFLDDQAYPFVANPHFLAWGPFAELPCSYVVYTPGQTPVLVYYQPQDYWHVVPGTPSGYWTAHFDIRIVSSVDEVAVHLPADRTKCILIGEIEDSSLAFGIDRVNPTVAVNLLHFVRGRKTEYELACMRLASQRAARGHQAAAAAFRTGASEFAIHRAYIDAVAHTDAELPYGNIIALDRHGAVLHYTRLDREPPESPGSLLIDAGAQVHSYAADVTRTYALDDPEFTELIVRVDRLQQEIVGRVRPGVDFRDLHLAAHRLLAELLVDVGLALGDPESLQADGVTAAFFPHGLGHLLGLQVHDVGGRMAADNGTTIDPPSGHPYLRTTRRLEENMVVTIEPGLYFIDMLLEALRATPGGDRVDWGLVQRLHPFGGIRIEDNVRVTVDGTENLTRDAFMAIH